MERGPVVFVELATANRYRGEVARYYPFLQGLARERGRATAWYVLGVPENAPAPGRNLHVYDLPASDRARLLDRLAQDRPAELLLSDRLDEGLWREVRARAPDARVSTLGVSDAAERLGCGGDSPADALVDTATPDYSKVALNDLARELHPFLRLVAGPLCSYRRALARNPHFRGVDLSRSRSDRGCSFCGDPADPVTRLRTPALELAMRQVLAAERTAPHELHRREWLVRGTKLWFQLDGLVAALAANGVAPSTFHFSCRFDELVANEARLRAALPVAAEHGHAVRLGSIGVENFSATENERFNKGTDLATIERGMALAAELETAFPRAFGFAHQSRYGFILYTPWTTLDDLRANVAVLRRHPELPAEFLLDTSLQAVEGRPLTQLAEQDGLLVEQPSDHPRSAGCIALWTERERPWRFRHPEVARVCSLGRRLAGAPTIPDGDGELQLVRSWLEGLPEPLRDVRATFPALVETVAALGAEADTRALLAGVAARLGAAVPALPGSASAPPPGGDWWEPLAEALRAHAGRPSPQLLEISGISLVRGRETGLEIALADGEAPERVWVTERGAQESFLAGARLALSYAGAPGLSPRKREALSRLLAGAEALLAGLEPAPAPGAPVPEAALWPALGRALLGLVRGRPDPVLQSLSVESAEPCELEGGPALSVTFRGEAEPRRIHIAERRAGQAFFLARGQLVLSYPRECREPAPDRRAALLRLLAAADFLRGRLRGGAAPARPRA